MGTRRIFLVMVSSLYGPIREPHRTINRTNNNNYKKLVIYKVLNKVGKITIDIYIKYILLTILDDFRLKRLTFY